jgi:hypothetical protein
LQLLGVDQKTLKKYRDNGYMGFTRIDDKYFYAHQDLMNFLMNKSIRFEPYRFK